MSFCELVSARYKIQRDNTQPIINIGYLPTQCQPGMSPTAPSKVCAHGKTPHEGTASHHGLTAIHVVYRVDLSML